MINIGDKHPEFVLWAGSVELANKWKKLIHVLTEGANENADTGYTDALNDELDLNWMSRSFGTVKFSY